MEKNEIEKRISELECELTNLRRLKFSENKSQDAEDIKSTGENLLAQIFLNNIIEHSPYALWISDEHGTLIRMNQACRDILFLKDSEVVGKYNILKDNILESQGLVPLVRNVFEKGQMAHFSIEYNTSDVKGISLEKSVKLFLNISISPIVDYNGKVTNAIIQHVDITKRKLAEDGLKESKEKLKQLITDKDRFISILAHDLISPFSPILGLLELLSQNIYEFKVEKTEKLINEVYDAALRVFNLLEETLDWANTQSGKIPFEPQDLKFTEICSTIIDILRPTFVRKKITVECFSVGEDKLFTDKNMFKVILRNLISNAIKFTNEGGKISIYAEQKTSEVIITVADNGIGIKQEVLSKLLDNNHNFTTSGTAFEKGSGLGLVICKEFVEKLGGTIWIESEFNKGSKFMFTIPKA